MKREADFIQIVHDPSIEEVGSSVDEFLRWLGGPTWLDIPGQDSTRTRAITTLLHGNEPSGVRALHRWLRSGQKPKVNLACFIGVVDAALAAPGFTHRFLPGSRDLNRCFRMPFEGAEGHIAAGVLDRLREIKPEALIDFHNTSGRSPAYGVTTRNGDDQKALTAFFSDHLIITDLRLGTLMEATEEDFPTITAECGRANDPRSDELAFAGLTQYALAESVFKPATDLSQVIVFQHPIRVELETGKKVAYAVSLVPDADVTLHPDADHFNFGIIRPSDVLGWVGPSQLGGLVARDAKGQDRTEELFSVDDGCLRVLRTSRIIMMTTDPTIAASDCLFYFIPAVSVE